MARAPRKPPQVGTIFPLSSPKEPFPKANLLLPGKGCRAGAQAWVRPGLAGGTLQHCPAGAKLAPQKAEAMAGMKGTPRRVQRGTHGLRAPSSILPAELAVG